MEITGKIIAALEPRGGVSQRTGNSWKSQEFVIETHEQYPKHCVFRVFGEDRLNQFNIQVGQELTVSFDIDAHEYNGRWYNDISAWRVSAPTAAPAGTPADQAAAAAGAAAIPSPTAAPAAPAANAASAAPAAAPGVEDDLPF